MALQILIKTASRRGAMFNLNFDVPKHESLAAVTHARLDSLVDFVLDTDLHRGLVCSTKLRA